MNARIHTRTTCVPTPFVKSCTPIARIRTRVAAMILLTSSLLTGIAAAAGWQDLTPPSLPAAPMRIGFDPADPSLILLGSYGAGLFTSTDAGATWGQNYEDFFVEES